MTQRIEKDALGSLPVPSTALWGIHTARALSNFGAPLRPVPEPLIRAFGYVKLACTTVNSELGYIPQEKAEALIRACEEMTRGELSEHIVIEMLQGGAGTSLNMNVNEVLANRSLQLLGHPLADYAYVHPLDIVNLHQSTNDTFPTALKLAILFELQRLEASVVLLLEAFQAAEKRFAKYIKVGRTELMDAVPITLGREFGAYAEAIARDRWRVMKCRERVRVINLGGTAIGTGVTAPRKYIFEVTDRLRTITGMPVSRAENLVEATQNNDALVEVMGILKAMASNIVKISNDIRLLSSGPRAGFAEINLPPVQEGSSIMPGKVNPVIPEFAAQAGYAVFGFDDMVTNACAAGNLELNAFLPLAAWGMLSSTELLERACRALAEKCIPGISACPENMMKALSHSTASAIVLVPVIGHDKASELAQKAISSGMSMEQVVIESGLLTKVQWDDLIRPERLNAIGESDVPAEGIR